MIDERTLTDATRCPSCSGPLLHVVSCPTCGVDLGGPNARAVWQVSVQAAGLLTERTRLIAALRVEASTRTSDSSAPSQLWTLPHPTRRTAGVSESTDRPGPAVPGGSAAAVAVAAAVTPAPEWTRRKVANLLLSLGVGLLAVAAVIFLVVSWSVLGIGGRAAVMSGATLLAGGGAALASRRDLGSTAEAVSLLTVGLGLLDALGARGAGLAGLDNVYGLVFWAGAFAVVAALSAATAVVVPTRSLRVAAATLGQLPVPLLTARLADVSHHPAAVTAAGFTLAALTAIAVAAQPAIGSSTPAVAADAPTPRPSRGTRLRDVRVVLGLGGGLAWLVACLAALVAAYGEAGSLVSGTVLLLALAAGAAYGVLAGSRVPALATAGVTAAAALVVAAAWSVPADRMNASWLPVVLSVVAVALLAASIVIPRAHRVPAALVTLAAAVAPGLAAVVPAGAVVLGQLGWLDRPWQGRPQGSARQLLTLPGFSPSFTWGAEIPLLLACVVVALVVADRVHRMRPIALAAVPLAALAAGTLPVAQDLTFVLTVAADLATAAALLLAGTWLLRRGQVAWGAAAAATALVWLGLAVSWSLALQSTTIGALAIAAVLLAGGALLVGGRPSQAVLRLSLGIAAALSAVADAAALARAGGAGWSAVWSLALGLAVVAASAAAGLLSGAVRRGFVVTATVSVLAEAAALTLWAGGSAASAGLAMTVAAGGLAAAAVWLDPLLAATGHATPKPVARTTQPLTATAVHRPVARTSSMSAVRGEDVATTAVLGGLVGIAFAGLDSDRLWLALLAAGVAASVASLRSGLHRIAWAAAALLVASSWVRLVLSHVDAPEPYTVPAGVALIAFGLWRRRREPTFSSWRAFGTGLGLAMGPSLLRAVADPGNLRPMLLGLAALVVLCSGIARRQKAPLVLGGIVLAIDGVVQLSPYITAFYAVVPRWSLIAAAGLLLLTLGMTYERRARELRALQHQISRFA
jgi:hypothetical protein